MLRDFCCDLRAGRQNRRLAESSLEWKLLPLALTSKAPPLDGTRVSDAIRSPSSRILAAKLTALGA
jgi:hypothetical protein